MPRVCTNRMVKIDRPAVIKGAHKQPAKCQSCRFSLYATALVYQTVDDVARRRGRLCVISLADVDVEDRENTGTVSNGRLSIGE